ncbi:MAG: hypothetical protein SFU56_05485 [Capsulimonadales bacterium]|nr:hypothetical protein [Capsulimonadales bacterium]
MFNNFLHKSTLLILWLFAVVVCRMDTAFAQRPTEQWTPHVVASKQGKTGVVLVNDVVVFRFREVRAGLFPFERAERAASRLQEGINNGARAGAVRLDLADEDAPAVRFDGATVATAAAREVPRVKSRRRRRRLLASARAEARMQAERWARELKRTLALPGLILPQASQVIPLAENRVLRLRGAARGPIRITTDSGDASIVRWQTDATTGQVTLTGVKPGRETVFFERDGAVATFVAAVKPYAGQFGVPHPVTVTGKTAPSALIARLARVAALASVTLTPGAEARVVTNSLSVGSVAAGQTALVPVPVRVTGPEMLPVERRLFVPVINRRLAAGETTVLFYSNNPERIKGPASLFAGRLPNGGETARLLYHHQNGAGSTLNFDVELINDSNEVTHVQMVGGDAGPERDTVWVGYRAAADYLRAAENGVGAVLRIPPHSFIPLSSRRLPNGQTVSGLMHLRTIYGPTPLIRISAETPVVATRTIFLPVPLDTLRWETSDPARFSEHVYPNPAQRMDVSYRVGGPWTFIKYGRVGLVASASPQTVLHGNYGVLYEINVRLENPTDAPARVRLVFEPSAGMAGGIFLMADRKVEIPQSDMLRETTLATYTLAPGENRSVTVRTLPLSGSNYPATIIVRP